MSIALMAVAFVFTVVLFFYSASDLRVPDQPIELRDSIFVFILLLMWSSMASVLVTMTTDTPESWHLAGSQSLVNGVIGASVGGALILMFVLRLVSASELGLCRPQQKWWTVACLSVVCFVALSWVWRALLVGVGVDSDQQLRVALSTHWPGPLALLIVGYSVFLAPVVEEVLFRGLLLGALVRRWGQWSGIIISSILFGLMHLSDPWVIPPLMVLGIVLGWLTVRSGSLWPAILAHTLNNVIAVISGVWG